MAQISRGRPFDPGPRDQIRTTHELGPITRPTARAIVDPSAPIRDPKGSILSEGVIVDVDKNGQIEAVRDKATGIPISRAHITSMEHDLHSTTIAIEAGRPWCRVTIEVENPEMRFKATKERRRND